MKLRHKIGIGVTVLAMDGLRVEKVLVKTEQNKE